MNIERVKARLEDQKRLGLDAAGYDRYLEERAVRIVRESRRLWARDISGVLHREGGELSLEEIRASEQVIKDAEYDVQVGVENAKRRGF